MPKLTVYNIKTFFTWGKFVIKLDRWFLLNGDLFVWYPSLDKIFIHRLYRPNAIQCVKWITFEKSKYDFIIGRKDEFDKILKVFLTEHYELIKCYYDILYLNKFVLYVELLLFFHKIEHYKKLNKFCCYNLTN